MSDIVLGVAQSAYRCWSLGFTVVNHVFCADRADDLHQLVLLFYVGEVSARGVRCGSEPSELDLPSVV